MVEESDLGVNFFLDKSSLGKSRAQSCADLLVELNPEVEGDWFPKNKVSHLLPRQTRMFHGHRESRPC